MTSTQDAARGTQDLWWREALGAVAVLISRLLTLPKTFWEDDELRFAAAVQKFDPWSSRPHPPGYPLYVGLGKVFALFTDPFHALVVLSVIASVITFIALAIAFRRILGDRDLGVCGALMYSFSATVLIYSALPMSDGPAMMFVALMLWAAAGFTDQVTERQAIALGLTASAAIGTRPQLAVATLPLFFVMLAWTRDLRKIAAGLISFTVLSLVWFVPLVDEAGGWQKWLMWEGRQTKYVATYDAAISRGSRSTSVILTRFLAHPWGPKWISIPVALLVLFGVIVLARKPKRPLVPIALFAVVEFVFAVSVMDPAEGARYSMPHMIAIALLIAAGLELVRRSTQMNAAPWIAAGTLATASLVYAWPVIGLRAKEPSPPAAAAEYAQAHFSPGTVIAYDLSLRPHAEYLLSRFRSMPVDQALAAFWDRPDVPVVIYGDGGSRFSDARVFSWPESDAYGKLTRDHYRVVSLDPVDANHRFWPLRGISPLERTAEGDEWRWLARNAALRLPHRHSGSVKITFGLSPDAPYDENRVSLAVNGVPAGEVTVGRRPSAVVLALPPGPTEIDIHPDQAFAPATVLHNQDPRILAVQLLSVE